MMNPIRILYIEDSIVDAELVEAHLQMQGFNAEIYRIQSPEEMQVLLREQSWDLILADYSLPQFGAVQALAYLKQTEIDVPFIVVSGMIGEDRAVEMLRSGARDFILKGDFTRLVPAIIRETTEAANRQARLKAEKALLESVRNFQHLADAMPQLVWIIETEAGLVYANERWYQFSGLNQTDSAGWGWTGVLPRDEESAIIANFKNSLKSNKVMSFECKLKSADNLTRWHLIRATSGHDTEKKVVRWYTTCTDIHEQKLGAEELEKAKRDAENASRAKSAFLANMSHEIRTPLGAVLGFAELMAEPGQSAPERLECISTIRRNGAQLARIINEILDLSKIESNRLEIEARELSLAEIIEDVTVLLNLNAQGKGLRLAFVMDISLPARIKSDPTRLRQLLMNIVGNAIKFTEKGEVTVKVLLSSELASDGSPKLKFVVKDSGLGISVEQSSLLFQNFMQVDNSMTRKFGGTGLGLVLSRRLAVALGGNLWLESSELGKGSTFIFTIDTHLQETQVEISQKVRTPIPNPPPSTKEKLKLLNKRVLVVDDSPDNRLLISRYLTAAGALVIAESDGVGATTRAFEEEFDAVLMDIQMPNMDGFEAIAILRSRGFQQPVIALTAHAMKGDRERCLAVGFTEHMSKPVDRTQLIELLQQVSL